MFYVFFPLIFSLIGGMYIFVRLRYVETIQLEVEASDTIRDVKEKIFYKVSLNPDLHLLIYGGKPLWDWKTLSDYDIGKESTLQLMRILSKNPIGK